MARIMVCDDDTETSARLCKLLALAGHEALDCRHTMDVLRAAERGSFDLLAFGLDMSGFGSSNAALALSQLAPHLPLVAFHKDPSALVGTPQRALLARVLKRPVADDEFLLAVSDALAARTARRNHELRPVSF